MTYTNIFGGYNVNTAFPSYAAYTGSNAISGNLQLNWSSSFVDTAAGTNNVTAQINDVAGAAIIAIPTINPISTTQGSGVVIVTIPANPNLITGNMVTIAGATDTNGITTLQLNITAAITVISPTSFSYTTAGTAGAGPFTGGGNAVTYDPLPTITLADATLISVGQEIQFNNVGANTITINNFTGGEIATIPPIDNNQYILYLQDNTTSAGTWGITHLGAGISSADASTLAGLGTIALNNQININYPGKTIGANYQVIATDRGSFLVWTGGTGSITLPNQLNGFDIAVNNQGSGVVTVMTSDATTIDGSATFSLNPSESCTFIGVNGNWNTLGFGIESFFQVNVLAPISLAAINPSLTLTNQQAARLVQQFNGALANDVTIYYPAAAGQWYVWNNTTGGYAVSAQLAGPTGAAVVLPQGEKVILYSDGTSLYSTPTIATSAVFPDGNAGAPGINFAAQSTTGFYRISSGLVGYSSTGTQSLTFGGATPGYGLGISAGLATRYFNATNTNYVGFKAGAIGANVIWTLPLADATNPNQLLYSDGAGNLHFTTATYPLSTTVNQLLYSSAASVITGLATANNGILITSAAGVPSISQTLPAAVQGNITTLGTIGTGIWNGTAVSIQFGGTGLATLTTAYGVVCAGTTATGALQNAGTGIAGQVLTSNGGAALATWQTPTQAAVKADQTTGTSTSVYVNPAVQQFHKSALKAWAKFSINGGVITINSSQNIASIIYTAVGSYTVNLTNAMADTNYCVIPTVGDTATTVANINSVAPYTTNQFNIFTFVSSTGTYTDPNWVNFSVMGNM